MALGVTPLRVGQEAYWLDQIARDRCEYYSGKGESPGWWVGSLAERTGLTGVADDKAVQQLFAGQDPRPGSSGSCHYGGPIPGPDWMPAPSRRRCGGGRPPGGSRSAS